jgi:hypothetical protein
MRTIKPLFFLISAILFTLACGAGDGLPTALPAHEPVEILTASPSVIPRWTHTQIPMPVFELSTPQSLAFPAWVTDFSNPILVELNGQRPDFQDDFAGINQGWFYFIPDNRKGPFYAHMQDEALLIQLPAENENKDYWVYNPKLDYRNFVLSFDLQFAETQPDDTVRFQFDQTAGQGVAFDLSKNLTWTMHWGSFTDWQSDAGTYTYFAPEPINILIVMQAEECAVYLNDAPLTYLSSCRTAPVVRSSPWAVTFHMLAEPGHVASATIDNLKLWDLDKIHDIP